MYKDIFETVPTAFVPRLKLLTSHPLAPSKHCCTQLRADSTVYCNQVAGSRPATDHILCTLRYTGHGTICTGRRQDKRNVDQAVPRSSRAATFSVETRVLDQPIVSSSMSCQDKGP